MNRSGIIIRLIDVAMIILFGFIAISDIKVTAQIKLPADDKEQLQTEPDDEPVVLFVRIEVTEGFVVEQDDEILRATKDAGELETLLTNMLDRYRLAGRKLVVLIEPNEDSMIQYTVDMLDICERNSIPFNINYESMQF